MKFRILIYFYSLSASYIQKRYAKQQIDRAAPPVTNQIGEYKALLYRVGLDCHEIKFHSKFTDANNSNTHQYLENWDSGKHSIRIKYAICFIVFLIYFAYKILFHFSDKPNYSLGIL